MKPLTERLYEHVKDIWAGYLEQDFVKEIALGTLAPEKFRFYMVQDYRYLLQYAKVFALGVVKADTESLMARFSSMVYDVLNGEMNVHKTYMKRLGITEEEVLRTKSTLTNQSYTSYMLDVSYRGGVLEILASVLACAWSYEEIGKHHATMPNALTHELYGEWVQGYSSQAYHDSTQEIIDCVNELGKDITPEQEARLTEIFVNCSLYERDFWEMAYRMQ